MKLSGLGKAIDRFARTERGKKVGNDVIARAADAANGVTGQKHADKITKAREAAERTLRDR